MLAKACRLEGLMLSMLSSELPFMVVEWCSTPSPKNFRLKTLLSNSNSSIQLAVLVWYTVSLFPQEVVMFSLSSYLKMVVSLCDSCLFITIHLPVVVSCSCSPRSPPPLFLSACYFIISKAVSLTPCSAVLCSGTKHNDSSRNTHFYQNAMPPDSWVVWKGTRIQGTRKERKTEKIADVRIDARNEWWRGGCDEKG